MKISTRYVSVKKSLLEEPENISLLFIMIPICEKLLHKYIYTLFSYQYWRQGNTRESERKENIV